jgi:hypothetical protein
MLRDALSLGGNTFSQKIAGADHLYDQNLGQFLVWQGIADSSALLFQLVDAPFCHRDVLFTGALVDGDANGGQLALQ